MDKIMPEILFQTVLIIMQSKIKNWVNNAKKSTLEVSHKIPEIACVSSTTVNDRYWPESFVLYFDPCTSAFSHTHLSLAICFNKESSLFKIASVASLCLIRNHRHFSFLLSFLGFTSAVLVPALIFFILSLIHFLVKVSWLTQFACRIWTTIASW